MPATLLEQLTQRSNSLNDDELTTLIASLIQRRYSGDLVPPASEIYVRMYSGYNARVYKVL